MKTKIIFLIIIVVQFLLLLGLKFTAWPEMVVWPYLMNHGWLPYRDIAIAHFPLMLFKLDFVYALFGVGILQLKIFTWVVILFFDILVYFLARALFTKRIALAALLFFAFWQFFYDGNGLWFDLFMGAIIFICFYFTQKSKWLASGFFMGLAIISKQSAVWFLIPIGFEIFSVYRKRFMGRVLTKFIGGGLIVAIPFVLVLLAMRLIPDFYNWAIRFGVFELPRAQGQIQPPDLKNLAISLFPFTVFLPLLFIKKIRPFNLILWAVAGMLGAYPRFEYFHFQPAIPYLAIASAQVFSSQWHKKDLIKAFVPVYTIGCLYLLSGFMVRNWAEGTRFYEKEVQDVVSYIKLNTTHGDKIFVMNWWDSIYALSDTLPATRPLVPQLSWYQELPGIQEKEVTDLFSQKPKLIILNEYSMVGLGSYIPQKVYDFISSNYILKEKIDGIDILIPKR